MEKVDNTRRNIVKKAWVVPTFVALGALRTPVVAGASSIPVDVCERNPHIPACNK